QLSLFTADLLQSLGGVLDVRWINDGIVHIGGLCTAQGALQNIGQAGIGMTTFIIALHTFDTIWRHGGVTSLKWAYILIGTVWTFLVLTVAVSTSAHTNPPFYAPTPYWCWINSSYGNYRTALENFWLWMGLAVSVPYIPLLSWDAGRVTPGDPKWWTFKLNSGHVRSGERRTKLIMHVPPHSNCPCVRDSPRCALTYCLPVLPTALARWFLVVHDDVKPFATAEAHFLVRSIFSLSGICDVVAFKFTRSGLLLCSPAEESTNSDNADDETSVKTETDDLSEFSSADINLDHTAVADRLSSRLIYENTGSLRTASHRLLSSRNSLGLY
ncbi:hypothetical protein DFH07DRAFT_731917, partial [Mycena maculata]